MHSRDQSRLAVNGVKNAGGVGREKLPPKDEGHPTPPADAPHRTERQRAYDALRQALVLRRIPAGAPLRESEWTHRLGVSRSGFREALARLHAEGLVIEGAKRGYRVPLYTAQELAEIADARRLIETGAIAEIVRHGPNPTSIKPLQELCDELEWMLDRNYTILIAEIDCIFHEALMRFSPNPRLVQIHRCLPQPMAEDPGASATERAEQAKRILLEHRALLQAIQARQLRSAETILACHYGCNCPPDEGEPLRPAIAS